MYLPPRFTQGISRRLSEGKLLRARDVDLLSDRFHQSVIGYCGEKGISRF